MNDPNWLYSSTAQSTAALVAIVGGFIVSRTIAMSSDREGFVRRMNEVVALRAAAIREHDALAARVYRTAYEWFREDRLQEMLATGAAPEDAYVPRGVSAAEVANMTAAMLDEIERARVTIRERYPVPAFPPTELSQLRTDGVPVDEFHEDVIVAVAREIARERRPKGS